MNILRSVSIGLIAAVISACSAAPSKPVAPAAPQVANVSGKWLLTVTSPMGTVDGNMTIVQSGKEITGTIDSSMGNVDLAGSVNEKEVKFSYSIEKLGAPAGTIFDYTGTVDAGAMKGKAAFAGMGEGTWTAKRQ